MPTVNSPDSLLRKQNALRAVIQDQVALAYNVTYPTLSFLGNKVFANQKSIKWNADVGGADTVVKDVIEDATLAPQGSMEDANLAIGQTALTHAFDVDLTEVTQAAATAVPSELKNIFSAHTNRGLLKIMRKFDGLLFTGDGTKASCRVIGFEKMVDNTYAYAGIDPVANPGWKSVVDRPGGASPANRALTAALLRSFETKMLKEETTYDVIITTPEIREQYMNTFDQRRSFQVSGDSAQARADLGISDVSYNGRPIIADPACTANTMYFLDSSELFIHTYRVAGDAVNSGLAIKIGMLPTQNIYSEKWEIGLIPQLQLRNRKALCALQFIG